jgi:hypothetical protein
MANMGYIRFENTYKDLLDCYYNLEDTNLSESEKKYKEKLLLLCEKITNEQ